MRRERVRARSGFILWLESCLWTTGLLVLAYCLFLWEHAAYDQARGSQDLRLRFIEGANAGGRTLFAREGTAIGRIEIPRLAMSTVVFEGTTEGTLARGVGHLTGSAPDQRGNLVLAGHRDTFFRPLRNIRVGDFITVTMLNGPFEYIVESKRVVAPDAVEVLRESDSPVLTLITCYPFRFIGSAPSRFIVRGRKIDAGEKTDE